MGELLHSYLERSPDPDEGGKVRFQVLVGLREGVPVCGLGVRACQGHSLLGLDELRLGNPLPPPAAWFLGTLVHRTTRSKLAHILKEGLRPGGAKKGGRVAVHFLAYAPDDPRAEHTSAKHADAEVFVSVSALFNLGLIPHLIRCWGRPRLRARLGQGHRAGHPC